MFKFFKEMKEAVQEGVEEAKEELKEEQEQEKLKSVDMLVELSEIPQEERFGTSLAAPFRTTAFMDWFTLFKSQRESKQEDVVPVHLYKYGNLEELDKDYVRNLKAQQEQSFDIENEADVLSIVQIFLLGIGISLNSLENIEPKYQPEELICFREGELLPAWSLSAAASTLVSGVELNGASKEYSLKIFSELLPYVQKKYSNWNEFGNDYIREDGLVNGGKKAVKQTSHTIYNLTFKFGSPWVQFPLENYQL